MRSLTRWIRSLAKLCFGTYFVLTSLYCLLAFIPYTYSFLIKEPPSNALIAFARYHSLLYWIALALGLAAYWERREHKATRAAWILLSLIGVAFTIKNFLPNIQNNWTAYACSVVVLLPLLLLAYVDVMPHGASVEPGSHRNSLLCYSNAFIVVFVVATCSAAAITIQNSMEANGSGFWYGLLHIQLSHDARTVKFMSLVLAGYLWLAVLIISVINLILIAANRISRRPEIFRVLTLAALVGGALFLGSYRFLENILNLRGWPAWVYAVTFAATLVFWIFGVLKPFFATSPGDERATKIIACLMGLAFLCTALVLPAAVGDRDWNGIAQNGFALLFWIVIGVSVYTLRPRSESYSAAAVIGVLLVAGASYWGITASAFLWAKPVGPTDGAIERALDDYAARNASFNLIYHWLDGGKTEPCEALCLTLRQYTNIRDPEVTREVTLVDELQPGRGPRPDIFIVVIDSMRPDYIGAYNPQVDFTPNLDNFARDSVVMRNAYTPYAGTTLAEPCIWTGTLLLHAHYLHPFEKVNTLERLLNTEGYQMILSYDSVLRRTVSANSDTIKLDTDKPWNRFEASSTFQQLETALDNRHTNDRPFFFYAQPMNVHQFSVNDLPKPTSANWKARPGMNNKAAYGLHQVDEALGDFFRFLKSHGLYDNSIIIITSDHGEGNEALGHHAHSTVIYPEVMHIPLMIHLPKDLRQRVVYDENELASLTDIAPSLYVLLGHQPIEKGPLYGRPLFAQSKDELQSYPRRDLLLASDVRAAYGLLSGDGRFMYVTYDSPPQSYLFDLANDPNATHSVLTDEARAKYEQRLIEYLQTIADFYGYRPNGNRALVASR